MEIIIEQVLGDIKWLVIDAFEFTTDGRQFEEEYYKAMSKEQYEFSKKSRVFELQTLVRQLPFEYQMICGQLVSHKSDYDNYRRGALIPILSKSIFLKCFTDYEMKAYINYDYSFLMDSKEGETIHEYVLNNKIDLPKIEYFLSACILIEEFVLLLIDSNSSESNEPVIIEKSNGSRVEFVESFIDSSKLESFFNLEIELIKQGWLCSEFHWKKNRSKKKLIDLLVCLNDKNYFKKIIGGEKKNIKHYRWYISELYGFEKTGLSYISRQYKPSYEVAKISYLNLNQI